jgi:prepilin-type N-terminal cleavage/methylation domain-containing protein
VASDEGFGLIELLIAMVVLNVGLFALMSSFMSAGVAAQRAATVSNGNAVADKVMEVYRGLENQAIYLNAPSVSGGNDVLGWPNGIPNSTSSYATAYQRDSASYGGGAYYSYANPSSTPLWVTQATTGAGYSPIPPSDGSVIPGGLAIDPTAAVQSVTGPDGQPWTVFTYIVLVQPSGTGWTGGYLKRVSVDVLDPRAPARIVAHESSLFDPTLAP